MKNSYEATVVEVLNGPDARVGFLEIQQQHIKVIHDDPYGNTMVAPTKASEPIVLKIGKDLEVWFRDL